MPQPVETSAVPVLVAFESVQPKDRKVSGLAGQKCMFLGNRIRLDGALLSERGNWIEALALGW